MIKLFRAYKLGVLDLVTSYKKVIDKHIDDYYTLKDLSIVDPSTMGRMYRVESFGTINDKEAYLTDICISSAKGTLPRVDYFHYIDEKCRDGRHIFIIIPEDLYRELTIFEKYALLVFLVTEVAFLRSEECLYEEDPMLIDRFCKVFPDFLAGRINQLIDYRVNTYKKMKNKNNEIPRIYQSKIDFKNIDRMEN